MNGRRNIFTISVHFLAVYCCRFSRVGVQCCKHKDDEIIDSLQKRYAHACNPLNRKCSLQYAFSALTLLGDRKGILSVKNWVVGYWHGYLFGTRLQIVCIWPSWCHCHSLSLVSVKSRLVLPFWYWLTRVVPEKGPLNGCVCVCVYFTVCNLALNMADNTSVVHGDLHTIVSSS